jgi:aryl-alcohol dehydrogenase-like predicted oxidoreductase
LNYRFLGNSGLEISEICFGVMSFTGDGGWERIAKTDQKDADRLTAFAIDQGVNFFDTADIYSHGQSEIMLGKALGTKRNNVVIATKCGFRMHEGPNGDGLSRKRIIEACDQSLKRLKTDYLDLYQMHSYDFFTPLEESLSAFNLLIEQGKVRYIGCSNFTGWQLMKAMSLIDKLGWEKFISLQAYYSLVGRDLELELVPVCLDQGIGIIPWSPLHGGVLTGKYRKGKEWPKETRMDGPEDSLPYDVEKGEKILDVLESVSKQKDKTIAQIALNYLLCKPGVDSVIIGARNDKQLAENIAVSGWKLSKEEIKELDDISTPPNLYPYWYFDMFRKDRM